MKEYYDRLGLREGASGDEIKKAYVKQIRKYSPESDPEQFKKIREAYEILKNAERKDELTFPPLENPWQKMMMAQINQYRAEGDMESCCACCEEAVRAFPDNLQFLYMCCIFQSECGYKGKAVKTAEQLVERAPDNRWFQKQLAFAYCDRGYTKKAEKAFVKAGEMGCNELDYYLSYAANCNANNQIAKGIKLILQPLETTERWEKEDIPLVMEAFQALGSFYLQMSKERKPDENGEIYARILSVFGDWITRYHIYVQEYLLPLVMAFSLLLRCPVPEKKRTSIRQQEIIDAIKKQCRSKQQKDIVKALQMLKDDDTMNSDERLCDTVVMLFNAYSMEEEKEREFAVIDSKLCMIDERELVLSQEEIIKNDYPDFYEQIKDFIQQLKEVKKISFLRDKLAKKLSRLAVKTDLNCYYYEWHPDEMKRAGICRQSDLEDEEAFHFPFDKPAVADKRISRNGPCPCGSGKKYKLCCGRK